MRMRVTHPYSGCWEVRNYEGWPEGIEDGDEFGEEGVSLCECVSQSDAELVLETMQEVEHLRSRVEQAASLLAEMANELSPHVSTIDEELVGRWRKWRDAE